jgi:hypothetical protein
MRNFSAQRKTREPPLRVANPLWLKIALVLGVPFMGFLGLFMLSLPFEKELQFSLKTLVSLGSGVFLLYVLPLGISLVRFMNHELHVGENGIEIRLGKVGKVLRWNEIGKIRVHQASQVFKLYDKAGRLVYAVDFYAENFYPFYELLKEKLNPPSPVAPPDSTR